jgi:hypothetical protein
MREVKARFGSRRFGYPKIGAGLAKGDWGLIAEIIDTELAGEITLRWNTSPEVISSLICGMSAFPVILMLRKANASWRGALPATSFRSTAVRVCQGTYSALA